MRFEIRFAYGEQPYDIVVMVIDENEAVVAASSMHMSEDKRVVQVHLSHERGGGFCDILSGQLCSLYIHRDEEVEEDYPSHMGVGHQAAYLLEELVRHLPTGLVAKIVQLPQPA